MLWVLSINAGILHGNEIFLANLSKWWRLYENGSGFSWKRIVSSMLRLIFKRGTGKSSWGENSIFNEIVKYGSNKVLFGANWDIQCHFSFLLSVRPQKIKNTKNKKQKNWFFEGLQKVRMKNEVGNLNLHQKVPIWT